MVINIVMRFTIISNHKLFLITTFWRQKNKHYKNSKNFSTQNTNLLQNNLFPKIFSLCYLMLHHHQNGLSFIYKLIGSKWKKIE